MTGTTDPAMSVHIFGDEDDEFVMHWELHDGRHHREDGPAIIARTDHTYSETFIELDAYHRESSPAIIETDVDTGTERLRYYRRGLLHRSDGPAVIDPDGIEATSVENGGPTGDSSEQTTRSGVVPAGV